MSYLERQYQRHFSAILAAHSHSPEPLLPQEHCYNTLVHWHQCHYSVGVD
jgi:hypothetical protein